MLPPYLKELDGFNKKVQESKLDTAIKKLPAVKTCQRKTEVKPRVVSKLAAPNRLSVRYAEHKLQMNPILNINDPLNYLKIKMILSLKAVIFK
jgi:hypothetical protein